MGSVAAPVLSPGDKEEQQLMAGFMESLAKYQDVMRQLQTQAKLLMMVRQTLSNGRDSVIAPADKELSSLLHLVDISHFRKSRQLIQRLSSH